MQDRRPFKRAVDILLECILVELKLIEYLHEPLLKNIQLKFSVFSLLWSVCSYSFSVHFGTLHCSKMFLVQLFCPSL